MGARFLSIAGVCVALLLNVSGTAELALADEPSATIFTNVNVLTMKDESILTEHAVRIEGDTIVEISTVDAIERPDDARIIDGEGGYLIPGLIDSHIHYIHGDEFLNYLAYGVTTVLDLGQPEQDLPGLLTLREAIRNGSKAGPEIYTTGQTVANHISLKNEAEALAFVRRLKQDGYDFIKVYNDTPKSVLAALANEGKKQGLAIFGHLPRNIPVEKSLSMGINVVTHIEEFYPTYFEGARDSKLATLTADDLPARKKIAPLITLLLDNNIAVIPNLSFGLTQMLYWDDETTVTSDPELKYLHPRITTMWEADNILLRSNADKRVLRERIKFALAHELVWRMHKAGVLLAAGTDAALPGLAPGKSLHRDIRIFVESGLSQYEALATATRNAGKLVSQFVDKSARIGRIEEGYEADLVLLASNPMRSIHNAADIQGVMSDGRWYARAWLEDQRTRRAERYAALREAKVAVVNAIRRHKPAAEIKRLFKRFDLTGDEDAMRFMEHVVKGLAEQAFRAEDVAEVKRTTQLNTILFPNSVDAWLTLAEVQQFLGEVENARKSLRRVLMLDPGNTKAQDLVKQIEDAE